MVSKIIILKVMAWLDCK